MTEATEVTWENTIKDYFTDKDRTCMGPRGVHLDSYEYVSDSTNGSAIYTKVQSGAMPIGEEPWSSEKVNTFLAWLKAGAPKGDAAATS